VAIKVINESASAGMQRVISYVGPGVTYLVVAVVISRVIPGNPDVIPNWVPSALVIMFRKFTFIGHFLLWAVISLGVVRYIKYKDSGIKAKEPATSRVAVG